MIVLAASEGANPVAIEFLPLITTIVVFGIAFFILKSKVWPRITEGLDDRDRKIREEITAAEDAREQANTALREYEESLAAARHEASEMIAKAKASAKAAGDELKKRNEGELAAMKQRATREIESARQAAVNDVYTQASTLATYLAGKILQREINVDDQRRLVEESLQELSHSQ